jgi:hypothetical protein
MYYASFIKSLTRDGHRKTEWHRVFGTSGMEGRFMSFSLPAIPGVVVEFRWDEAQSPAGSGAVARFSSITYDAHGIGNIYK